MKVQLILERSLNKIQLNCEKNRKSKPFLTYYRKNTNFDIRGAEYILPADVDQIKKEIKVENPDEDHIGCTDDVFTINADLKTQVLKTEDGIDIVYEDIKPEIHGDKLSGKNSLQNDIAKIVPNESSIDFGVGPQQNRTVEEDETDVERGLSKSSYAGIKTSPALFNARV
ncbi:hypothetical protein JTB14_028703 [Gonioctena quinquepunctata]|nr:hypothetical protein JTB14_028703 [Gonioctena quinquepunctata]